MNRKKRKQDPHQQSLFDCVRQANQKEDSRLNGNLQQLELIERQNYVKLTSQLTELQQKRQSCIQRIRRIEAKRSQKDNTNVQQLGPVNCRYTTELPEHAKDNGKLLFGLALCAFANTTEQYDLENDFAIPRCEAIENLGMKRQLQSTEVQEATHQSMSNGRLPSEFLQGYCHSFPSVLNQLNSLELAADPSVSTESTVHVLISHD